MPDRLPALLWLPFAWSLLACSGGLHATSGEAESAQLADQAGAGLSEELLPSGPFIEILGVAQDAGVPQAACGSENCDEARRDPAKVRYATSFALVGSNGETYLFEATPDLRPQLDRVLQLGELRGRAEQGRKLLDGVFVTHAHMGHYSGLLHLGFEAAHSQGVPVYGSERMMAFLRDNQPWRQLLDLENLIATTLGPERVQQLADGVRVFAIAVPHRDELSDTVAWRIEGPERTLLFMPDCDPWSRWKERGFELEPMLEGVDTFLVDATFYSGDELPGRDLTKIGHPMVRDSMELFGERVARKELEVVFIHFNHSNPLLRAGGPEAGALREAGFGLAHRGLRIEL
jgi:pyrroloquinoline quinone biosynthesis protein B